MNLRGKFYLTVLILWGFPSVTTGAESLKGDSILNFKTERGATIGMRLRQYYTAGSSTMHYADDSSISDARLTVDSEVFDSPVVVQEGTGYTFFGLSAESYFKLSERSTVWGDAGYHNGTTRDIRFSDVTDYATLAPFVLMDDTGGNLRSQRYDFGGGWSSVFGKWTIGAQATYRATIAHRAVDPRVRNIVSDLNVSLGGARMFGNRYMLGVDLGVRVYNQDTDVDFYNPVTHAITVLYTGLGSTASRFKGADAQSSTHRMTGFCASLRFVPSDKSERFYAEIDGAYTSTELILNGYNNLNFGTTSTGRLTAKLSRLISCGHGITFFPTLSGNMIGRTATENLFGSSADNYVKIGERSNYHHDRYELNAEIPISMTIDRHKMMIGLSCYTGYVADKEYLTEPARSIKNDFFTAGLSLEATKGFGRHWMAKVAVGYEGRFIYSSSAAWGGLDLTSPEGAMCLSNYNMSSCDIATERVCLTLSRAFASTVAGLTCRYTRYDYHGFNRGNSFTAALSLTF